MKILAIALCMNSEQYRYGIVYNRYQTCDNTTTTKISNKIRMQWHANFAKNRLIIVSSNDEREYSFCDEIIKIEDYK